MKNKIIKIILEGTDGVGKTASIERLRKQGIECIDRSKDVISKYMLFTVSIEERTRKYEEYLKTHDDIIIFLINNDSDELMERIYSRDIISDFDLETPKYNKLYLDTYNYMKTNKKLYGKLFLLDCTNLTLDEQVEKIKETIEKAL